MSYLFLTTVAPSILLIYYFFTSDKYREPIGTVLKITFYGVLICFPAVYGNQFVASILGWNIAAFTVVPIVEEGLKFLVFYKFVCVNGEYDEPMDAIVYAVCISLGFATLENLSYVYVHSLPSEAMFIALMRGFTAVPAHALFGLTMGLLFINYSFIEKSNHNLFLCFLYPALLHSTYNFLVGNTNIFLMVIFLIIAWRVQLSKFKAIKAIQSVQKNYQKV
ncbi:MAG: PrsW family intramembrane metalloprotease [Gammaproteobacteria bacterium]|jgi:protease PrsW|nr:PrsW family intramembrane metalloprotease [Gammaproteobacteria bacterium]MBT7603684.1 PrsW family intramembrane metalloprotease [Gammaproteobacteria bacterium]